MATIRFQSLISSLVLLLLQVRPPTPKPALPPPRPVPSAVTLLGSSHPSTSGNAPRPSAPSQLQKMTLTFHHRAVAFSGIKTNLSSVSKNEANPFQLTKGVFIKATTISAALPLPNAELLFDLDALYRCLQTVPDQRSRQGWRYPLASILMIGVLTKLAGQDSCRAIAEWAKLRTAELRLLFALKHQTMPH